MAYEISNYAVKATFVAQDPLEQYSFVQFYSQGSLVTDKVTKAIDDTKVIGVVQNAPLAGQEASVLLVGITKVVSDTYINPGDRVKNSMGRAKVTSFLPANNGYDAHVLGTALTSANAGEIVTVAISTPAAIQ